MNKATRELLEQHFDTAFAAPDGVKKLRELILTLAMQGKLVPQDPNDQPGAELLKEIEQERLTRNSKGAKGKNGALKVLPEIKPEEITYPLPGSEAWQPTSKLHRHPDRDCRDPETKDGNEGINHGHWIWVRLRDICHDWGQKTPDSDFTYIDVGSIDNKNGVVSDAVQLLDSKNAPSRARKLVKKGTVLYSTVRPYLLNIAIIEKDYQPEAIASTAFAILHPYSGINNRFIYYFLRSPMFINRVEKAMKGVAYPAINDGDFFQSTFPLPPVNEQHRIVAKIEQLMAHCDELEKLRAEREQRRLAVHAAAINQLTSPTASFPRRRVSMTAENQDSRSRALEGMRGNDDGMGSSNEAWQFITQHFAELYAVKPNVAELRKAILQLAVMGKLVPQDPNDPPASELLKEIEAEKQRLVKEGKIKPARPLPEIRPEEFPNPLPEEWKWVRVVDIVDVGTGSTPATTNSEYYGGSIPWYTSSATNKVVADPPETFITEKAIKETNCKIFPAGSLIIALYGQGKTRGQISEIVIPGATNQAIAAMVFYESSKSTKNFIKYYFIKIYEEIRSLAEGAAQPNLNVGKIKETLIPFPPLPEQHRIVAKIDSLMALCDTLEYQIDAATSKQTALLDAVMAQV